MRAGWHYLLFILVLGACHPQRADNRSTPPESAQSASASSEYFKFPKDFGLPKVPTQSVSVCPLDTTPPQKNSLSTPYLNYCAGCHGTTAEGSSDFPSLRSIASIEAFKSYVRGGNEKMPAFSSDIIDDATLEQDFSILSSKNSIQKIDSKAVPYELPNSVEDYSKLMREGLSAWRRPGVRGSCQACHGPDGIDLARIDYPAGAILRRAMGQGLKGDEALAIVRMIGAQRRQYKIDKPCRQLSFVPMQPGGRADHRDEASATDQALYDVLKGHAVDLSASVESEAESQALLSSIANLDVRTVPIGVELNHWTEDSFHGGSHRSSAEWLPEIPMEPKGTETAIATWVGVQNGYLENPSTENLWKMLDEVANLTGARFNSGGVSERMAREKYRSVLLMQHMLRVNDLKLPDLSATKNIDRFSVWETAQISNVMARGCADLGTDAEPYPCWSYPPSFYKKMGTDRQALLDDVIKIDFPWLVAGWILEPTLQFTEAGGAQIQHLYQAMEAHLSRFAKDKPGYHQLPLHGLYFGFTRMIKLVESPSVAAVSTDVPLKTYVPGCWNHLSYGISQWLTQTLPFIDKITTDSASPPISLSHKKMVQNSVTSIHRAVLYKIFGSLSAPRKECAAMDISTPMTDGLNAIEDWHKRNNVADTTVSELIRRIRDLNP